MTSSDDLRVLAQQLGRAPRGVLAVAARCACGAPAVVRTQPRLEDGTPFPTMYYLTSPPLNAELSTLESLGVMSEMSERLAHSKELTAQYRRAHEAYLGEREAITHVPEIAGISAGGMPERVKCLHALAAHSLAVGFGVNPIGDEALEMVGQWCRGDERCRGEKVEGQRSE